MRSRVVRSFQLPSRTAKGGGAKSGLPTTEGPPLPEERGLAGAGRAAEEEVADVFAVGLDTLGWPDAGRGEDRGDEIDGADDGGVVEGTGGNVDLASVRGRAGGRRPRRCCIAAAVRSGEADTGVGGIADVVILGPVVSLLKMRMVSCSRPSLLEWRVEESPDLGVEVGDGGGKDLHLGAEVAGIAVIGLRPGPEGGVVGTGLEVVVDGQLLGCGIERGVWVAGQQSLYCRLVGFHVPGRAIDIDTGLSKQLSNDVFAQFCDRSDERRVCLVVLVLVLGRENNPGCILRSSAKDGQSFITIRSLPSSLASLTSSGATFLQ